jgi:hypothetical protein
VLATTTQPSEACEGHTGIDDEGGGGGLEAGGGGLGGGGDGDGGGGEGEGEGGGGDGRGSKVGDGLAGSTSVQA